MNVQTLDRKIWSKELVTEYLNECYYKDIDAVIDFTPEGSCATSLGMYRLLDGFCERRGYDKERITIITGNMLESHDKYQVIRKAGCWYEITSIQKWLINKEISTGTTPVYHFSNFISRSNWYRLWIATILDIYYRDKSLQTFHYDPDRENYNGNGYIGIDDLIRRGCDLSAEAVKFIESCPRTLDLDFLKNLDNTQGSIFQHNNSYYPIQHPSNLNLLQYYHKIFVDIVAEPNISGNCFLVTEKLWRPIIARRPFIAVSTVDYLKNLKKLGFRTFDRFWDESYDDFGAQHRIKKIEELLAVISNLSIDELSNYLIEMQDILDHNYRVFLNLTNKKIEQVFTQV